MNKIYTQKNLETKINSNESDFNEDVENILLESIMSNYNLNFLSLPINKSYYINCDNLNINSSLLTIQ